MNTKGHPSSKVLIIVRHAHRDTEGGGYVDNGLTEKGHKQADRVKDYFSTQLKDEEEFPKKWLCLSSPKKRCKETIQKVAAKLKTELNVEPMLDEGSGVEARAERFLDWWLHDAPEATLICSHGDWIPEFTRRALGLSLDLKKAGWMELRSFRGHVQLTELIQDLKKVGSSQ